MLPPPPYVLLDDAREGGAGARLYAAPREVITAMTPDAVAPALERLRAARGEGRHAAGWIGYGAAAALVPGVERVAQDGGPLLWFGLFDDYRPIAREAVTALLPDPAGAWAGAPVPAIDRAEYGRRLAEVQALIAAGDLYQANLTFRARVPVAGSAAALYARLRRASAAGHGALIDTGERQIVSLSPELFVTLDGDALTCRPMKGTAPRGEDATADARIAAELIGDAKQRAENLMIVDLMRSDLSRVAAPGSVQVPALFAVERYPTIHQLTSTVTARLAPAHDAVDVIAALFPCGSVTGAPKRRAIEVIDAVEASPRGAYCGAIGRLDANGGADFNVAIRTLTLIAGEAVLGLGSGIVADSQVDAEWAECLAKGGFITAGARMPDLVETMAFDPIAGIALLERHLARMKASAAVMGLAFDRHAARNELQAATFRLRRAARVRLLLGREGTIAIEVGPLPSAPDGPVAVAVVPLPVDPADYRLRHKTGDRGFYNAARAAAGTFEVAFTGPGGWLTEGSFTSLFVPDGDRLATPPLARGLLPGVLRAELLDSGRAFERDLLPADLAGGFLVGNALRGLLPAHLAVAKAAAPPL